MDDGKPVQYIAVLTDVGGGAGSEVCSVFVMTSYEIVEACQMRRRSARKFPLLVQFASGCKPASQELSSIQGQQSLQFVKNKTTSKVLLKAEVGKRKFLAVENDGGDNELGSQYMIGVVDKKRKTMRLVEVSGEYLMRPKEIVEPIVEGGDVDVGGGRKDDEGKKLEYKELRSKLIEGFGGRRAKVAQKRRQRNDDISGGLGVKDVKMLDSALDQRIKADEEAGERFENTSRHLVPPHDINATDPKDAYPLHGLFEYRVLELLKKEVDQIIDWIRSGKGNEEPSYSDFSWQLMKLAVTQMDSEQADEDSQLYRNRVLSALYLHYLIVYSRIPDKFGKQEVADLFESTYAPKEVSENLLELFAEKGERGAMHTKTTELQDKLIYYALIMWLTTCGFKTKDIDSFVAAFQMRQKECLLHLKFLGCSIKRFKKEGEVGYRIALNTPLEFPVMRSRYGARKRR